MSQRQPAEPQQARSALTKSLEPAARQLNHDASAPSMASAASSNLSQATIQRALAHSRTLSPNDSDRSYQFFGGHMHISGSTRNRLSLAATVVLIIGLLINPLGAVAVQAGSANVQTIEQSPGVTTSRTGVKNANFQMEKVSKVNKAKGDGTSAAQDTIATYIVVLEDPAIASYKGGVESLAATNPAAQGQKKLDLQRPESQAYAQFLEQQQADVITRMNRTLDRSVEVVYTYQAALNGFAAVMTPEEASRVEKLEGVEHVIPDWIEYAQTDAGPTWIGAPSIWGGGFTNLPFASALTGDKEVPAVVTNATGTGTFEYNFDTNELHYEIHVSNIMSITAAHIHSGALGVNGAVLFPLYMGVGTFDPDHPISGTVVLNEAQQAQLMNQALYVNVHTEDHPGGEIRDQIVRTGTMGEGMVVGIIDTGINMDHPSFADIGGDGYNHSNPRGQFYGWCNPDDPNFDPNLVCNDKLIGVWSADNDSPEDANGHGSHTGSTVAGNVVENAQINGRTTSITVSRISGVAPHANIIGYSIEGTRGQGSAPGSATIAATEQAIIDEVDVINYSFGGGAADPWLTAEHWFNVREAGIFVATSAANTGPGPATVGSPANAPWLMTVAASSHNRQFANLLMNMTGGDTTPPADIVGEGITNGYGPAPIVYAGDVDPNNSGCDLNYAPGTFNGEIVVCEYASGRIVTKSFNLAQAGAGGYILINSSDYKDTVLIASYALPGMIIPNDDGQTLKLWLASGSNHTATIGGVQIAPAQGDIIGGFSSRGPNGLLPDVIKPDITAPGRSIVAAVQTTDSNDPPEFDVFDGTSMASPHAAGAATLIRAIHSDWTPAEVQSALMTTAQTAGVLKEDAVTPADPFDRGAGRVDLTLAMDAGLVLDEEPDNLWNSNPADGGDPRTLNLPSMADDECLFTCSWTRTVKSTLDVVETWNVTTSGGNGATISVEPEQFTINPGATQELVITANVSGAPFDEWSFGEVQLTPAGTSPVAHLPVAVVSTVSVFPEDVDILTRRNAGSQFITGLKAIEITDLTIETFGLRTGDTVELSLNEDATVDPYDNINDGTVSVTFVDVPAGTLRLAADVIASEAPDVDLYVGTGTTPSEETEECVSATVIALESCVVNNPEPGTWWILVQNFDASGAPPDAITLSTALVVGDNGNFTVEGPQSVPAGQPFDVRVFYDVPTMQAGQTWYGAFTLGTDAAHPGNLGTIFLNVIREADDVTKVASVNIAAPGDTISYQIEVATNVMPEDLTYTINDLLPEGLTYVEGSATASAGTVTVEDNTLQWTGVMTSPANLQEQYIITNSDNDAECTTPFGGYADLEALAGFGTDPGAEGDTVGFTYGAMGGTDFYGSKRTAPPLLTDDGFILFGENSSQPFVNQDLPNPTAPNGLFAPYWRDMEIIYDEATNKGVTVATADGGTPDELWLVEYDDIQDFEDPTTHLDLEIFVFKDAYASRGTYDAFYAFDNVVVGDQVGTIGVENDTGDAATQFSFNNFTPTDDLVFCLDFVGAEPVLISYDVTVDADAPAGLATNSALHNTDMLGSQPATATASVEILGLEVTKSANTTEALVDETITYTYRITNTGNVTLTIEAVDDRLDHVDELENGELAPQETRTATLTYVAQLSDTAAPLVNTVTVTGTSDLGVEITISDSAIVNVGTLGLEVDKVANRASVLVGEEIIYTYRITNTGTLPLTIEATDDHLGSVDDLENGELAPQESRTATLTYVAQDSDTAAPLFNTLTVTGTSDLDPIIIGVDSASVTVVARVLELEVDKSADRASALVGETVNYTYRITNTGNVTLTTVANDDHLGVLSELASELAPQQTLTTTRPYVVVETDLPGPLKNTVTVNGTDNLGTEVTGSDIASVNVIARVLELEVDKSASATQALVGDTITYTYQINNTSNVTLTITAVDDRLGVLSELAGELAPQQSLTTTRPYVVGESDLPGPLENTVTVTGIDNLSTEVTESDSASVNVIPRVLVLEVDKSANRATVLAGEEIIYTYRITNTGNVTLTITAVDDHLGDIDDLEDGELAPLETRTVTRTYVTQLDEPSPLVNTVTVIGTDDIGNEVVVSATAYVDIVSRVLGVEVEKSANTAEAMIGQTITYTYRITNGSNVPLTIDANDDHVGAVTGLSGELGPQENRAATAGYVVQESDAPGPLVNTVTVTGTDDLGGSAIITDSASVSIVLPVLNWESQNFVVDEEAGSFDATVNLSPTNPYAEVRAQVVVTDSNETEFAATLVQEIVFPPGSGSQAIAVTVPDDDEYAPQTILLGLQAPIGAVIGGSNGGNAVVTIVDDDAVLGLEVSNSPNTSQADVGETITYTYRITNTGNITLTTIVAQDTLTAVSIAAAVPGLAGELPPQQSHTATVSYVAQQADTAAPLVNTLTVTGTDTLGANVVSNSAATVVIGDPTNLPEEEQPQQQGNEIYLPRLEN